MTVHSKVLEGAISALRKRPHLSGYTKKENPGAEARFLKISARKLRNFLESRRGKLALEFFKAMTEGGEDNWVRARIFLYRGHGQLLWFGAEGLILVKNDVRETVTPEKAVGIIYYEQSGARCRADLIVEHIKAATEDFIRPLRPYL